MENEENRGLNNKKAYEDQLARSWIKPFVISMVELAFILSVINNILN